MFCYGKIYLSRLRINITNFDTFIHISDSEADGNTTIFFRKPPKRRNFELTPTSHAIRRQEIAHVSIVSY